MTPINEIGTVGEIGLALNAGTYKEGLLDASGALCVMDFYTKAMLDRKGFQVRAGTITTPLVGDVVITDTAAEFCIDPPAGWTILPVCQMISIRLATGTLHEYATKSVATASTGGAAFVLLPLATGTAGEMTAAVSTARVAAAGGVAVTGELATTTRRHWEGSNPAAGATGALPTSLYTLEWSPRTPPPITTRGGSAWCIYTQIAAASTGPSYYAHMDILEFASAALGI